MSDQDEGARPPLRGDEAELFQEFNRQFVRTVQWRTNARARSSTTVGERVVGRHSERGEGQP